MPVALGAQPWVDASVLGSGGHTLDAVVSAATPLVRNDPNDATMETHSWAIAVPEPSTPVYLGVGCFGLALSNRRRSRYFQSLES